MDVTFLLHPALDSETPFCGHAKGRGIGLYRHVVVRVLPYLYVLGADRQGRRRSNRHPPKPSRTLTYLAPVEVDCTRRVHICNGSIFATDTAVSNPDAVLKACFGTIVKECQAGRVGALEGNTPH